jgi:hypothetical protein
MTLEERSALRRQRIKSHRAKDFAEAERWDLLFWQEATPEERLSAFCALRRDVQKAEEARRSQEPPHHGSPISTNPAQ